MLLERSSLSADEASAPPITRGCVSATLPTHGSQDQSSTSGRRHGSAIGTLLGTRLVEELVIYLGIADNTFVGPVVERMMAPPRDDVQVVGGRLAAYAGLELGLRALLDAAVQATEAKVCEGAATICAHRLPITAESERAGAALAVLFDDDEDDVRDQAAVVAAALRDRPLAPHKELIEALIARPPSSRPTPSC